MSGTVSLRDYGFDAEQELQQVELLTQILPTDLKQTVDVQLQEAKRQVKAGATDAAFGFLRQVQDTIMASPAYQEILASLDSPVGSETISLAIGSVAGVLSGKQMTADKAFEIVKGAATTMAAAGCTGIGGPIAGLACGAAAGLVLDTFWGGLQSIFSPRQAQQCVTCATDLLKARAALANPIKRVFDAYKLATGGSYNEAMNRVDGGYVNFQVLQDRLKLRTAPVKVQYPNYLGRPYDKTTYAIMTRDPGTNEMLMVQTFDAQNFSFVPQGTPRGAQENVLVSIEGWELRYRHIHVGSNSTYTGYWATGEARNAFREFSQQQWDWGAALTKGTVAHFLTSEGKQISGEEVPGGGYLGMARSYFGPEPSEDQQKAAVATLVALENAAVLTVVGWWMEVVNRIENERAKAIVQRNQEVMRRYEAAQAKQQEQQAYRELANKCVRSNQTAPEPGTSLFARQTCINKPPGIRDLRVAAQLELDFLTAGIGRGGQGYSTEAAAKRLYNGWKQEFFDIDAPETLNLIGPAIAEAAGIPACARKGQPGLSEELCPDLAQDIAEARDGSKQVFATYADQMRHMDQTLCAPKGQVWSVEKQRCLSIADAQKMGASPQTIQGLKDRQNCLVIGGIYDVWDRKCKSSTEAYSDAVARGGLPPPGSKPGATTYLWYAAGAAALGVGSFYAARFFIKK